MAFMTPPAIITPDHFIRIKRALQSALGLIVKLTTFVFIAVFGGLFSSWYVIGYGATFNTERVGPWEMDNERASQFRPLQSHPARPARHVDFQLDLRFAL